MKLSEFLIFFTIGWFLWDLHPRVEAFIVVFGTILACNYFARR